MDCWLGVEVEEKTERVGAEEKGGEEGERQIGGSSDFLRLRLSINQLSLAVSYVFGLSTML